MSCNNLIKTYLNELCPDFELEDWQARDDFLDDRIHDFMGEWALLERQARYLAEEIYLDSCRPERVVDGISDYLRHYGAENFAQDQARIDAIARICQDGMTKRGNASSEALLRLLVTPQPTIAHLPVEALIPLQEMKDVKVPTRFGDMVFLPRDAEIFVIGDTHGDLASTKHVIAEVEQRRAVSGKPIVVFLGDYMHNGVRSWETLLEILLFQQRNPESVILLSGNHEFRESYRTALHEYFDVHWAHFAHIPLPAELSDRLPERDNHYGHMRLDLARSFGFAEGERIYQAVQDWGIGLPWICISDEVMLSHSLGKTTGTRLHLVDLINGKQDGATIKRIGPEAWGARRHSAHSAMVNNRIITADLLDEFQRVLEVTQFVVGHCHYRAGDSVTHGDKVVTTVVSSDPYSPDSGHYMYYDMVIKRAQHREKEDLHAAHAMACYLSFRNVQDGIRKMAIHPVQITKRNIQ